MNPWPLWQNLNVGIWKLNWKGVISTLGPLKAYKEWNRNLAILKSMIDFNAWKWVCDCDWREKLGMSLSPIYGGNKEGNVHLMKRWQSKYLRGVMVAFGHDGVTRVEMKLNMCLCILLNCCLVGRCCSCVKSVWFLVQLVKLIGLI